MKDNGLVCLFVSPFFRHFFAFSQTLCVCVCVSFFYIILGIFLLFPGFIKSRLPIRMQLGEGEIS